MFLAVLLFIILFSFLAWRKLEWAVLVVAAALPSYMIRFSVLGVPMTLLEAMIQVVFAVWVIANWRELKANIANVFRVANWRELFANRANGKVKIPYPFQWEMILLLVISFMAVGVAGFSNAAFGIWKAYFVEPMLFYIVLINILGKSFTQKPTSEISNFPPFGDKQFPISNKIQNSNDKIFDNTLIALGISAISVSLLAIYQKITGQFIYNELWAAAETRRVVSFFGYPNAVGLYLGPLVLLFVGFLFSEWKKFLKTLQISNFKFLISKQIPNSKFQIPKIIFITITIFLSLLAIYFAKSEGALIGIAAGLVVFGILAGGKLRWATIIGIILILAGIFSYAPARNYVVNKITLNDFSGQVRKLQWAETWKMLKDGRLFFGSGLANYQDAIKSYHQEGFFYNKNNDPDFHRKLVIFDDKYKAQFWQPLEIYMYPHNIVLNFWTEVGLFGVLLFMWIIIKYFCTLISNFQFPISKQFSMTNFQFIKYGLIGAMIVIVVHGLVDVPYFKNDLAVMFWIFLAMMSVIKLEVRSKK